MTRSKGGGNKKKKRKKKERPPRLRRLLSLRIRRGSASPRKYLSTDLCTTKNTTLTGKKRRCPSQKKLGAGVSDICRQCAGWPLRMTERRKRRRGVRMGGGEGSFRCKKNFHHLGASLEKKREEGTRFSIKSELESLRAPAVWGNRRKLG